MITCHVLHKKLKSVKMDVFTGYVIVRNDDGKYLYSKYTNITSLSYDDAMNDAMILKDQLEGKR